MTRFTLVARVASKESGCVMSAIIGMLAGVPKDMLKSCTFDSGKDFAFFKQLEQALGIKVYFAKPYHSWERGTNENRNGVVREETSGTRFAVLDRPGDSSVRLDGEPLATVRRAEGLPRNYGVLYRETAPFTLGYGAGSDR